MKRRTVGFLSLIIACSHVAPFALAQVSTTGSVTSQVYNNVIEVDQMGQADWCQDVATACSHFSTLTDGVVLDARGFPPGSAQICGVQPLTNCGNNPFKLLIGPYEIDTSVGWVTPYQPHIIEGTTTSSGAPQGTFIIACGPGSDELERHEHELRFGLVPKISRLGADYRFCLSARARANLPRKLDAPVFCPDLRWCWYDQSRVGLGGKRLQFPSARHRAPLQ